MPGGKDLGKSSKLSYVKQVSLLMPFDLAYAMFLLVAIS